MLFYSCSHFDVARQVLFVVKCLRFSLLSFGVAVKVYEAFWFFLCYLCMFQVYSSVSSVIYSFINR